MRKQVGVVCYICGREFGTRSIGIHEPQCVKKWEAQNNKLTKAKRQTRPIKPIEFAQTFSTDPKVKADQIEKMNLASNVAATENLVSCSNCGRSFLPTRIEKHEEICCKLKMSPGKHLQSGSGSYGQRVVVVDGEQVEVADLKREETTLSSHTITKSRDAAPSNKTNILQKVQTQIHQNVKKGPPMTVPCQFCNKPISHNAINIHIKKCKSRSDPLPVPGVRKVNCPFCNREFPHNAITAHTTNCSAKPHQKPRKQPSAQNLPTKYKAPIKSIEKSPSIQVQNSREEQPPYQRYSPRPQTTDRLTASLDPKSLNAAMDEEVVIDLILGVDPGLVINCMVCGLIVLKSKLNTHYHNYCQKSILNRYITIPPSTKRPQPPPSPQLVTCHICNRNFKDTIIADHESECAIKSQNEFSENGHKALADVYEQSSPNGQYSTNTLGKLSSPTHVVGKVVTGRFVPCINCGKSFTVRSLVIHQKQCMK